MKSTCFPRSNLKLSENVCFVSRRRCPADVLVDLGITAAGAAMAFVMSMSEFELVKAWGCVHIQAETG